MYDLKRKKKEREREREREMNYAATLPGHQIYQKITLLDWSKRALKSIYPILPVALLSQFLFSNNVLHAFQIFKNQFNCLI